jgi:hypothetical protein
LKTCKEGFDDLVMELINSGIVFSVQRRDIGYILTLYHREKNLKAQYMVSDIELRNETSPGATAYYGLIKAKQALEEAIENVHSNQS